MYNNVKHLTKEQQAEKEKADALASYIKERERCLLYHQAWLLDGSRVIFKDGSDFYLIEHGDRSLLDEVEAKKLIKTAK